MSSHACTHEKNKQQAQQAGRDALGVELQILCILVLLKENGQEAVTTDRIRNLRQQVVPTTYTRPTAMTSRRHAKPRLELDCLSCDIVPDISKQG